MALEHPDDPVSVATAVDDRREAPQKSAVRAAAIAVSAALSTFRGGAAASIVTTQRGT
jgi:hypothetical protein